MKKRSIAKIVSCIAAGALISCFALTGCAGSDGSTAADHSGDTKVNLQIRMDSMANNANIDNPMVVTFDALDTQELWQMAEVIEPDQIQDGATVEMWVPSQGEYVIEVVSPVASDGTIYRANVDALFEATGDPVDITVQLAPLMATAPDDAVKTMEYEHIIMSLERAEMMDNGDVDPAVIDSLIQNIIRNNGGVDPRDPEGAAVSAVAINETVAEEAVPVDAGAEAPAAE